LKIKGELLFRTLESACNAASGGGKHPVQFGRGRVVRSLGRMKDLQFSKPYERTHDVVENIEGRFCYPTMSLKKRHLSHLSHDLIENTRFALPSVGLSGSRAALFCTIKVLEAS
jgi:hypothetical protein